MLGMNNLLTTALLLEEKASKLARDNPRRAELLALAKAARRIGIELAAYDYEFERDTGSHQKRVDRRQRMTPPQPGIGTNKLLGVRAKLSFANLSKHKN